jgi:hypothetical protein
MKGRPRRVPDEERCQGLTQWGRCHYRAILGGDPRLCNVHRKVYERGTVIHLSDGRAVQRSPVPLARPEGA